MVLLVLSVQGSVVSILKSRPLSYILTFADCDSTLRNGGGAAFDGNMNCNMNCHGNADEICGGDNRLSLYSYLIGNSTIIAPSSCNRRPPISDEL
jgi:hypothetical protein